MVKVKYAGGIREITVVLPSGPLRVSTGDTVEVSPEDADRLCALDGFTRAKSPKAADPADSPPKSSTKEQQ